MVSTQYSVHRVHVVSWSVGQYGLMVSGQSFLLRNCSQTEEVSG